MNWPNRLTTLRIILVPVFILTILYHELFIALVIFIVAAVTDGLDGYLARVLDQKTSLGTVMDPIADKLLIGSAFFSFSLVSGLPGYLKIPIYVPLFVISRDVLILCGAMIIYVLNGKVDVKPTVIGKITTFFQIITVIALLIKFPYSVWLWNIVVVLTVVSGLDYFRIGAKQANGKTA